MAVLCIDGPAVPGAIVHDFIYMPASLSSCHSFIFSNFSAGKKMIKRALAHFIFHPVTPSSGRCRNVTSRV